MKTSLVILTALAFGLLTPLRAETVVVAKHHHHHRHHHHHHRHHKK